ncbi:uncharacterized protein LOC129966262 [Argiope bruennichi]|uniref:uncharacterized protein LOC129966262 n=1 Tax=Argiope bruennichi TaxID=94029 RepID=UPI00249411C8|nr:uncharacterized protein LOC129966262 [Argiope bruennichi]
MGAFQVNKDLIPNKAHYFLLHGAHADVLPFITVYAKQLGISADVTGLIMAILCSVISRPLIGSIADHLQKLKLVMIALIFIDISADMGLNFIPPSTTVLTQSSVVCHQNVSYIFLFAPYTCKKNSSFCDKCILSCDICQDDSGICLKDSLGHSGNSKGGNFSDIPFECFEEATSYCPKVKNTTICVEKGDVKNSSKNPILHLCLLSIFTAIIYICYGSIVSLSDAACCNALGTRPELYGKQRLSLDASQLVLGCSSAVQCFLGELPFFFFAGWIISKIGHINTFTMSFVANGLRFFTYSFIKNPWLGLLIDFLQGPCFGTFYTAMTSYAKKIAPEGTEATVQGLASGTFEGLGVATGSLLGGYGFRTFGGRKTLFWTGIISFAFGVINSLINYIMIRNQSETPEK